MHAAPWNPDFAFGSPLYEPLRTVAQPFTVFRDAWPTLEDYQRVLQDSPRRILTQSGVPLRIVAQDGRPQQFEQHYAPRIYLTGELQTRFANWHDFFQFLTWLIFPRTKAVINALHVPQARKRIDIGKASGRRTPLENMLSLFDEGGVVLVSSDSALLDLVREFRWKDLFWARRSALAGTFQCITFGHALYEKALNPYVGMTANAVPLLVDAGFFELPLAERLAVVDKRLAVVLGEACRYVQPKDLQPFPVLGMPGWDPANAVATYYDNTRYFRPGRGSHGKGSEEMARRVR